MPISQTDQVFRLVKSLTKAEKRNFKLYAKRIQDNRELMFIQLFNLLDKQKELDEKDLLKKLGGIYKGQYSNLKRHLYSQIITSLRLLHRDKRVNIKVREQIDFAYILYGKGLYIQALKILNKAKVQARKNHLNYALLTIVEMEKLIESRHITRSGSLKAYQLIEESKLIHEETNNVVKLSNLRMRMHGKYLKSGHVKNKNEAEELRTYYHSLLDLIDTENVSILGKIYLMQSRVWYNHILMDFESCLKYAIQWVQLLKDNPAMVRRDIDMLLRGYHYVLTSANNIKDPQSHSKYLKEFEAFRKNEYHKFNPVSQIISFLYVHSGRLDDIIITGYFSKSKLIIPKTLNRIKRYSFKIDDHRILVFYYKFAWIHLANNEPEKAIVYLTKIINRELSNLREDLQKYARILHLMCHYELKNFELFQYLLKSSKNYFQRKKANNKFLQLCLSMFDELKSKGELDHKDIFKSYVPNFEKIGTATYERRAILYLDINVWLKSKIKRISMGEIIKKNL